MTAPLRLRAPASPRCGGGSSGAGAACACAHDAALPDADPRAFADLNDLQRGLHSPGDHQGRMMVDAARAQLGEHAPHHFRSLVRRALEPG